MQCTSASAPAGTRDATVTSRYDRETTRPEAEVERGCDCLFLGSLALDASRRSLSLLRTELASMGDVRTHSQIFETFVRPNLPDDVDPVYVEFGNYLTDVSQFLDPWAHVGGKGTVWRDQVGLGWRLSLLADIAGADGYLDFLLGLPDAKNPTGPSRHGKLAAWFREVIYVYSLEDRFKEGGDPSRYLIDPPEFKRLYDLNFTQYYRDKILASRPNFSVATYRKRILYRGDEHKDHIVAAC